LNKYTRVLPFGYGVKDSEFTIQNLRGDGLGFRVEGLGFRV
jgi:hypothetical protein